MKTRKMKVAVAFRFLLFVLNSTPAAQAWAQETEVANADTYYVISEKQERTRLENPLEAIGKIAQQTEKLLDLRSWIPGKRRLANPHEVYSRQEQFGGWIVGSKANNCLNTRSQVLVRDSLVPVTFSGQDKCTVEKGEWFDKSNGQTFYEASKLDIDHLVPLKNAYRSGAWRWSAKQKCLYANFMGNDFHLIPLSAESNRTKGDQGPEGYMPSEKSTRCEYLQHWLMVKTIWRLALLPEEARAIRQAIEAENCNPRQFFMTESFLKQQRQWMIENQTLCTSRGS